MDQNNNIQKAKPVPPFVRYCSAIIPTMFDDSLSYYEALCALNNFLQTNVIDTINNNASVTEEYIRLTNELKEYVENYFENLDVQEEINNKLDAMVEAGTLQEIIGEYLNATAIWGFDSVSDMKSSTNLINGSYARTLGYYTPNDGGGALYKIRNVTNDDAVDEAFLIEMGDAENQLVAELIIDNNEVNIRQLGARSQATDNTKYDIAPYITKYLSKLDITPNRFTLKIPAGVWTSSQLTIHRTNGFSIIGDEQFIGGNKNGGTVITSLTDNQTNIFTIGNGNEMLSNFTFKNFVFSTGTFLYSEENKVFYIPDRTTDIKTITNECLRIQGCQFGDTDNLYFQEINGRALTIKSSWEIRYRKLYFRDIDARNSSVVLFGEKMTNLHPVATTNASMMDNVMFELTLGDLFSTEYHSQVANFHFGVINFEDNKITRTGVEYTDFTSETIAAFEASNPTHWAVFRIGSSNFDFEAVTFDSIELDQFSTFYSTIDGNNYCYDKIFAVDGGSGAFAPIINTITVRGVKKNAELLNSNVETLNYRSAFILNKIYTFTTENTSLSYNVSNFPYIRHDGRLMGATPGTIEYYLPSNVIQAYKHAIDISGSRNIISDADSKTEPKLCIKLPSSGTGLSTSITFTNQLIIVAKIPNGETATLAFNVVGASQQIVELAGTGAFTAYTITLGPQFQIGRKVNIGYKTGNTATSCIIDYLIGS